MPSSRWILLRWVRRWERPAASAGEPDAPHGMGEGRVSGFPPARPEPPLPTEPEYLESLALREYERAGMSDHAPWLLAQIHAESGPWRNRMPSRR